MMTGALHKGMDIRIIMAMRVVHTSKTRPLRTTARRDMSSTLPRRSTTTAMVDTKSKAVDTVVHRVMNKAGTDKMVTTKEATTREVTIKVDMIKEGTPATTTVRGINRMADKKGRQAQGLGQEVMPETTTKATTCTISNVHHPSVPVTTEVHRQRGLLRGL